MSVRRSKLVSAAALAALVLCTSSSAPPPPRGGGQDTAPQPQEETEPADAAKKDAGKKKDEKPRKARDKKKELKEKRTELEKKSRELRYAQLELRIAHMKLEGELSGARDAFDLAESELESARKALASWEQHDRAIALAEAGLGMERAERRLIEAREDLDGILAIYADEEEAQAKDAIIGRHRANLERAEKQLEVERAKQAKVLEGDLPAAQRKLDLMVRKAGLAVVSARREQGLKQASGELEVLKKEDGMAELEQECEALQKAIGTLEKAVK